MNLEKLKKYTELTNECKIFGITEYKTAINRVFKESKEIENYDDDSISNMIYTCETASNYLDQAAQSLEEVESSADEWRELALAMWEDLDKDKQEQFIAMYTLIDERRQAIHKAFKLEDLKKL